MGYHIHHAIVVTCWQEDAARQARELAVRHFANVAPVTDLVASPVNFYWSFLIAPDGSKEGWTHSDLGDCARMTWIEEIERLDIYVDWVEVAYGGDEGEINTRIVRHGDESTRAGTSKDA